MNRYQPSCRTHNWTDRGCVAGRKVRVLQGPLAGLRGTTVVRHHPTRIMMALDSKPGVFLEIDQSLLKLTDDEPDE